jgi:endonuclease/exonuclease/phosphatase family metal-dependent hydrolase
MSPHLRVVTWNCRKASAHSPLWDYLAEINPDIAVLQEVAGWPARFSSAYQSLHRVPIRKSGAPQAFKSVILIRGKVLSGLELHSQVPWVDAELSRFAGNLLAVVAKPEAGPPLNVICVYSPAWPVDRRRLADVDTSSVRLKLNRDVWVGDLLWSALRQTLPQRGGQWLIAGDFNLCETFDAWRGGPRGNREYLDRMQHLGLVDCLRHAQGTLTPTFRTLRSGKVTAQIDYMFVTRDLQSRLIGCQTGSRERVFGQGLSDHLPVIADFATEGCA